MLQTSIHYFLHFGLPLLLALLFFRSEWKKVYLIFISTMLVDLDHLLASPIFQANRCSIQFHPLHTYWVMIIYLILSLLKRPFNLIGFGLLMHMVTDFIDCIFIYRQCQYCAIENETRELIQLIFTVF